MSIEQTNDPEDLDYIPEILIEGYLGVHRDAEFIEFNKTTINRKASSRLGIGAHLETRIFPLVRLDEVEERLEKLEALEAHGVDNWSGYAEAMKELD